MQFTNRLLQHIVQFAAGLLLAAVAFPGAYAQTDAADPPGRVGRLADLSGQVWLFTPDSGEWVAATRNRPLTAGDRLSTDAGARAEVRIGSTTLRLDSGSELELLRLDDERMAMHLHNGSLAARLRNREAADEFDLKTTEGQFTVQRAGRYRFDRMDGTSHLTVYNGQALYEGPRSALTVNSGQRAEFWIDANDAAQYSITEPQRDTFSAWNNERDRSDDRSVSARYVSPEMTGVEDLDRHGRWEQNQEYGPLWIPRGVAPGWAPYNSGHWAWVRPWGWTWVDDAPWGFAPFHYGRWVWHRSAWCWAPGTYVARPIYAPALVAWVGGPSLSVSLSIGGGFSGPAVGWFPLGPREVYVPSYRHTPRYIREVNVTHVTNITNVINAPTAPRDFSNRKFPHAVTVVPTSVMTSRQAVGPVSSQLRDVPAVRELVQEPGRHGALLVAPVTGPVTSPATSARIDPRGALRPGVAEGPGGGSAPTMRASRPGQRDGDFDRAPRGAASRTGPGDQAPAAAAPANTAPVGVARPGQITTPPPAAAAAPTVQSPAVQGPARQAGPPRPVPAEPGAKVAVPQTPAPAAQVRGEPRQRPPIQDGRAAGNAGVAGPVQSAPTAPRAVQGERIMPDRRHNGQPPAAAAAQPAEAPVRARAERPARDEDADRRRQRERSMAN